VVEFMHIMGERGGLRVVEFMYITGEGGED